ncbi:MAG: DNA-directed RNA polymerase subunit beta' [Actinomycetota bacterium]|nr:DNA-directed RNA polymerase subunit beta' [Actinomycetota bacterium]
MLDVNFFDELRIGLATADDIRQWSHGEVKKPETINYRTLKPEKDGLFCEKIFGPTRDWECYCGKYKRVRFKGIICERCGVEVTRAKVRRERMGHIELAAPVTHIWYFKGVPSRLGYLLDLAPKDLEKVIYFAAYMITEVDEDGRTRDLPTLEAKISVERQQVEQRRDADLNTRQQRLEQDLAELEAEGAKADARRKVREGAEREMKTLRDRAQRELDRLEDVWTRFKNLKVQDLEGDEILYREMRERFGMYFSGGMGAAALQRRLESFDLDAEAENLREIIRTGKGQKKTRALKRLKVVSAFLTTRNSPMGMVLDCIPVIPPDLRPMVQLDGGRFATSDLNDLYRRVINRNNRLKRLLDLGAPEIIVNNEKRMLQEAVDALFDNGRRGRPVTGPGNRPLKSLSDMLKGKQGRFRQNLLGKRVDYSGRSVIVVGPQLKLHQCGLPKQMALELFKPFVMKRLVDLNHAQNIKSAKRMVERARPVVWDVLEEVIAEHPVLLNRAPTLHRLGIQAFEPVLVEGKAIQVHPLVCHAFNADFDGDQMAVHLPLSAEAQAEARILMLSSNNILSPAHGAPLTTPTQDMVLGAYYLTYGPEPRALEAIDPATHQPRPHVFRTAQEAELAYEFGTVKLHDIAEFRPLGRRGGHVLTTVGRIVYNDRIERALLEALGDEFDPNEYEFINQSMKKRDSVRVIDALVQRYGPSTVSQVLDAFKDLGFQYATQAGITISKNDVVTPPDKDEILARYDGEVAEITDQYDTGLITQEERHEMVRDRWTAATDEVGDAMTRNLDELNPIFMMANSGARGSFKQVRQLAGMRGLMANPKGEIIERPIKANFMEGLSVLEYFISTHGARKGLADTALRTADSGYLTRRLVDVAQDVIIREADCGTEDFIDVEVLAPGGQPSPSLLGRIAARDIEGVIEAGQEIDREHVAKLATSGLTTVPVRSVLKCQATSGLCQLCYGRSMASGQIAQIGDAVGIIAAQSIGEPGTQLTMRTFHTGGVAGADITHGLPRVVELFEARKPKGLARMAEQDGMVGIEETDKAVTIVITDDAGEEHRYAFPRRTRVLVERGERVEVGRQLVEGSLSPADILALGGGDPEERRTRTERYLVKEVQEVYKSQGVDINDKHIEVIARQMMKKVRVEQKGDTDYLPGQFVDRFDFHRANGRLQADGGEAASYEDIILGITKASLNTDSFLSAASFQETTKVLTDAALEGKIDRLNGLKENVIIGKLIPAATGLKRYRRIEIEPAEPLPRADEVGLLDSDELAAELGLGEGDGLSGFDSAFSEDIASLEDISGGTRETGFAEELADLDVPEDGR